MNLCLISLDPDQRHGAVGKNEKPHATLTTRTTVHNLILSFFRKQPQTFVLVNSFAKGGGRSFPNVSYQIVLLALDSMFKPTIHFVASFDILLHSDALIICICLKTSPLEMFLRTRIMGFVSLSLVENKNPRIFRVSSQVRKLDLG